MPTSSGPSGMAKDSRRREYSRGQEKRAGARVEGETSRDKAETAGTGAMSGEELGVEAKEGAHGTADGCPLAKP